MSFVKRLWLSITRRLTKSVILFLIVFLLGNVLCASIAIATSLGALQKSFMTQLGLKIDIVQDEQDNYLDYEAIKESIDGLLDNINSMAKKNYFQYNDAQFLMTGFISENLSFSNKYLTNQFCDKPGSLYLYGVSESQFVDANEKIVEIIEGRYFTEDEVTHAENVILLSDKFTYKQDEIKPGDVIQFERVIYDAKLNEFYRESVNYTVVGIFSKVQTLVNHDSYDINNYDTYVYLPSTTLFNEYSTMKNLYQQYQGATDFTNIQLKHIKLKLKHINLKESFEKSLDMKNPLLAKNMSGKSLYIINTSEDLYQKLAVPLKSLENIAFFLRMSSSVGVTVLLGLSVFIFLKDRRYEIGILYSMGQRKVKIITQILLEVLIIGMSAITLAMFSGQKIGDMYAEKIVQNEIEANQYVYIDGYSQKELLEKYDVEFSVSYIINIYISGFTIICVCSVIPIAFILKLNPKKILLQ